MKTPLRKIGHVDHRPQALIVNAMEGVTYDYYYSGQKVGSVGQIELSVTSIITDWDKNIYYLTCRYLGHHESWEKVVRTQIYQHLEDLGVGVMLVRAMLSEFKVDETKKREWVPETK